MNNFELTTSLAKIKERDNRLKKIALDLFERCESEELTVWEYRKVLELMSDALDHKVVLRKRD